MCWGCSYHPYQCLATCSILQLSERTAFLVTFTSFRNLGKITLIFSKKNAVCQSKEMTVSAESEIKLTCVVVFPQGIYSSCKNSSDIFMSLGVGCALRSRTFGRTLLLVYMCS